jgi:subtilisin family serine protease
MATADDSRLPNSYIVVLKDSVAHPGAVAETQTEQRDGDLGFVYRHALKGYSAELSDAAVKALRQNPSVDYIAPDHKVEAFSQTTPTGIGRISADEREDLDIDETDDVRVDADIAILDTGVDPAHPDLNFAGRTDCTVEKCVDNTGVDKYGHGTHVAGIAGALDNNFGAVGVAPGARIWSVKVLEDFGVGSEASLVAGVDWVTAHASEIEVANMSLGCECSAPVLDTAIAASAEAGVVYALAAGNFNKDVAAYSPTGHPDAITVSALADYDGAPEGLSSQNCEANIDRGKDDTLAMYSNWGAEVDVAAPGTCIYSTLPTTGSLFGSNYGTLTGTSMASPYVAGAAAILASKENPGSKADVEAIRERIVEEGSLYWEDNSGDGVHEPLLDLRPPATEAITQPASNLQTRSARLQAVVSPGGLASTYRFEYGLTTTYGTNVPATPVSIGSSNADFEVGERIGVEPETTYHYRVAVTNSAGTTYGKDRTFKTSYWSIQETPSPTGEEGKSGELFDVSCASATECIAVGKKLVPVEGNPKSFNGTSFAERWNGTSWSIISAPVPSGATESRLENVSCPSTSFCLATGYFTKSGTSSPFSAKWDGSKWTVVNVAIPSDSKSTNYMKLNGISCVSSTSCLAVGNYDVSFEGNTQSLVETWNGTEWTVQAAPKPEGKPFNRLMGVSCSSASQCTAVGSMAAEPFTVGTLMAARWDGSKWTSQAVPTPAGAKEARLMDVSCPSVSTCMAVGNTNPLSGGGNLANNPSGLTASWNGTEWQLLSSGLPGPLWDVSCASASSCHAVGRTMGKRWNGSTWSPADPASPMGASQVGLEGIACVKDMICETVGHYYGPRVSPGVGPLAEGLTPSWTPQTPASLPAVTESRFEDVSCASASLCVSVGNANKGGGTLANAPNGVAESWNGSTWSLWQGGSAGRLFGVSCAPSSSFCVGVGMRNGYGTLIERWDGTSWKLDNSPDPWWSVTQVQLKEVSCTSTTACTAVGHYLDGAIGLAPLAERWNGTSWAIQTTPNPSGEEGSSGELLDVSCASATECIAVGRKQVGGAPATFAERWNGGSWSIISAPVPSGATASNLENISCPSTSFCLATGYFTKSGTPSPFSAKWDGSKWSIVDITVPGDAKSVKYMKLNSISCVSSTSCLAVGNYDVSMEGDTRSLAETWNGTEWTVQSAPKPEGKPLNRLMGVSCSSASQCTAVGSMAAEPFTVGTLMAARWE